MTKKDYERAASIVREITYTDAALLVENVFVRFFADDNEFDVERFRTACIPNAK